MLRPIAPSPARLRRPVIVHYHIFKNAGSTVVGVLRREFGDQFSEIDSGREEASLDAAGLLAVLRRHSKLTAVSGHHLRYPAPCVVPFRIFDLCLIRHPLDRLYSIYSYLRKPDVHGPFHELAKKRDLPGFFEYLLANQPFMVRNAQVNLLACAGSNSEAGEEECKRAVRMLPRIALLGVVDRFDQSLVLAEYLLHPYFPQLQLHYCPENLTNSGEEPLPSRLSRLKLLCGLRLFTVIREANQYDYKLYRGARMELCRRFLALPGRKDLYDDFRNRCRLLQQDQPLRERVRSFLGLRVHHCPLLATGAGYPA